MTKRLRVSRAKGEKFGRFGDRNVDLGNHDFVVVLGDNETGKSTLAEMVAWLLAGRRSVPALGKRLVNFVTTNKPEVEISGSLFGKFGDEDFEVRREFIIKRSQRALREDPTPTVRISKHSKSETEWKNLIAIKNGDDYFYRYRIIAGGPEKKIGLKELLEAASAAVHGFKTPGEIKESLDNEGKEYCPKVTGRGTTDSKYAESSKQLNDAKSRRAEIDEAAETVNTLEQDLLDAEALITQTKLEQTRCLTRKSQVVSARKAVSLRCDVDKARARLAEKSKPEDYKWEVEAERQDIAARIGALETNESHRLSAEESLKGSLIVASLPRESLDRIQISIDVSEEVKRIEADLRKAEEKRETCSKQKKEFDSERSEAIGVLSEKATMLKTTVEHLKRIGSMALDDASFGDPLRQWGERADDLGSAESRVSNCYAKYDLAVRTQEEAKKAWDKLGQTITPIEAVANSGTSQVTPTGGGFPKVAYIAIFAVTVLGSFVDGRLGALLGLAGVVLAVVDVGRAQRRTRDAISSAGRGKVPNDIAAAAKQLNDADSDLQQARDQVKTAVGERDNAKSNLEGARKRAVEVLETFGFAATADHVDAGKIRIERESIKKEAEKLANADRGLVKVADEDQRLAVSDGDLRERLRVIAEEIGLLEGPSVLSAKRAQAVLEAKWAHDRCQDAKEKVDDSIAQLAEVAGPWVRELPVERIKAQFEKICFEVQEYQKLDDHAQTTANELTLLAPENSEVLKIIADSTFDEASGEREEKELDAEDQTLNGRITKLNQDIGRIKSELGALATKDNLPRVEMEVAKQREEVRNAVLYGGAYYLAAKIVQDIKNEVEQKSQPALVREATVIAERVTGGDWQSLIIDTESADEMEITQGHERYDQDALSTGAKDALILCIRLAAARLHAKSTGIALPLVLDDPSGSIDANRMSKVLVELQAISKEHQVIVLTHNSETAEQIRKLGGHVINMPA